MLPFTVDNRIDELVDECQRVGAIAFIVGKLLLTVEFAARTIQHQTVWLSRVAETFTLSDSGGHFPGLYACLPLNDRRKYVLFERKGLGLVGRGIKFDARHHRMSQHFAVTESRTEHWFINDRAPFWQRDFLLELKGFVEKIPAQPERSEALAILDTLTDQLFPYYSAAQTPQDGELCVYTMRTVPSSTRIASHARPSVKTSDPSLVHIINCCEHVQNASYLQFILGNANVCLSRSSQWNIEDLSYLPDTHALPGLFWIQRNASTLPLELDPLGFGLQFTGGLKVDGLRQCTLAMLNRITPGIKVCTSRDKSMADIAPCLGELPALFPELSSLLTKCDAEMARFFRNLGNAIDTVKRISERAASGKASKLFTAPLLNIWSINVGPDKTGRGKTEKKK